jgi:hypothetical protein
MSEAAKGEKGFRSRLELPRITADFLLTVDVIPSSLSIYPTGGKLSRD